VSDHGCPPVQLGDGTQIDRECQYDLLPLAQAEIGGFDEYASSAQIHSLAQLPAATRISDVDNGSSTVPRVKAAFHLNEPRVILLVVRRDQSHYAVVRPHAMHRFNLIAQ
jgi:hypothetical protein